MKHVNTEKLEAFIKALPTFSDAEGVLAYVFPFTTKQIQTPGLTFNELAPGFKWDINGREWANNDWLDI